MVYLPESAGQLYFPEWKTGKRYQLPDGLSLNTSSTIRRRSQQSAVVEFYGAHIDGFANSPGTNVKVSSNDFALGNGPLFVSASLRAPEIDPATLFLPSTT